MKTKTRRPSEPCAGYAYQLIVEGWILCRERAIHWYGADGVVFRCIHLETLQPSVVLLHPDEAAKLSPAPPGLWGETLARFRGTA